MATTTRANRLHRRLASLHDLGDRRDQGYDKSLAALKALHDKGRTCQRVRLRRKFCEVAPTDAADPSASQLISPRGHALRVALIALFVAQTKPGSAPHVLDLPLSARASADIAWEDLVVTTAHPGAGSASRMVHEKRAASARAALKRLAKPDISLLELPKSASRKGAYDAVRLFEDTGPRDVGLPVPYTTPTLGKDVLTLPVDFFLNGWVYVLQDTEIVTYLMYRLLCSQGSPAHISSDDRRHCFGIKQSAWEQYWVLQNSGIIRVEHDESRRPDGTVVGQGAGATLQRHRFFLEDNGLAQDALPAVRAAIERRVSDGGQLPTST